MMRHRRISAALLGAFVAVVVAGVPGAAGLVTDDFGGEGRAYRGVAGTVIVNSAVRLRARDGIGRTPEGLAPISVRVEFDAATGIHTIEFVGAMAGTFDLRDVLERADGGSIAEIDPIPVLVISRLPESHGSDLFESSPGPLADAGAALPWTRILIGTWVIWPVLAVFVWMLRRRPHAEIVTADALAPTLDEEIAALLDRAADESIGTDERARLELLVFHRLSAQIESGGVSAPADPAGAPQRIAETVRELRRHPDTRELVRAIEAWLHARGGATQRGDAIEMLREFRRRQSTVGAATFAHGSAATAGRTQETQA